VRFLVMDAESLGFDEGSFDVVVGSGILHHLALRQSRVLRPDGCAVFVDPLGHNIFIRLYRKLTPSMRTADEHPLLDQGNSTGRAIFPRSRRIFHAAGPGRRAVPEDAGVPCPGTSR
jgi:SAM-dependent methyltransferase